MDAALLSLRQGLADLRSHLDGMEKHNQLLSMDRASVDQTHVPAAVREFYDFFLEYTTRKAVIDYSAVIILLYGLIERFVEACMTDYLRYLNDAVPSFRDLPPKLRDTHTEMSAQLILNLKLPKYNNLITKQTIIQNLSSCSRDRKGYRVNAHAYIDHPTNFRIGSINDFLPELVCRRSPEN
jgi:HEPN superfamily RiboL-PSP-like protein